MTSSLIHGKVIPPTQLQTGLNYEANFAVQRDIGFSTTVEVAYVGNFGRHSYQQKSANNLAMNAFTNPVNLFNGEAICANFIVQLPWHGGAELRDERRNRAQLQLAAGQRPASVDPRPAVWRRLHAGQGHGHPRLGLLQRASFGHAANREMYYGPLTASDQGEERRHVAVLNYCYQIPTINEPVLKYVLGGWEASGVSTFVSGDAVNPSCQHAGN